MRKYILELVVFIGGAVVMIFELDGSRILAPSLGTSLFVWTSLIGIILGSLSLGYFLGGRLADKHLSRALLSFILFCAAILVIITIIIMRPVLDAVGGKINDIRFYSVLTTIILFTPASVLFGMISPYAIRLKLESITKSGRVIGQMYALSTLGSIVGTFAAGFFLIPFFGSTRILVILVIILIATALLLIWPVLSKKQKWLGLFLFVAGAYMINSRGIYFFNKDSKYVVDIDSSYYRIFVKDGQDPVTKRPIRVMQTDPYGVQGGIFLDKNDSPVFNYTKYFRLVDHFFPSSRSVLLIGGGVYTIPVDYISRNPQAAMDVIEIDPTITRLSRQYFGYQDDARIKIHHQDGRIFLNQNQAQYDAVFIDAFGSYLSIPFHLTTQETMFKVYSALNEDGVMIINIISALGGEKSEFLRAELATINSVFPQAYVFAGQDKSDQELVQNIIVVALKSKTLIDLNSQDEGLKDILESKINTTFDLDIPILTDDYAPVDHYAQKLIT